MMSRSQWMWRAGLFPCFKNVAFRTVFWAVGLRPEAQNRGVMPSSRPSRSPESTFEAASTSRGDFTNGDFTNESWGDIPWNMCPRMMLLDSNIGLKRVLIIKKWINGDEWWWTMMETDEWWWMMMKDDEWWWMMMMMMMIIPDDKQIIQEVESTNQCS